MPERNPMLRLMGIVHRRGPWPVGLPLPSSIAGNARVAQSPRSGLPAQTDHPPPRLGPADNTGAWRKTRHFCRNNRPPRNPHATRPVSRTAPNDAQPIVQQPLARIQVECAAAARRLHGRITAVALRADGSARDANTLQARTRFSRKPKPRCRAPRSFSSGAGQTESPSKQQSRARPPTRSRFPQGEKVTP